MTMIFAFVRRCFFSAIFVAITTPSHAVIIGGMDWRQVADITGYSWNDIDAIFDTTTGQCDVAGCLLGGTVDLTDYTWADNAAVDAMIQAFTGQAGLGTVTPPATRILTSDALDGLFASFTPTYATSATEVVSGWTRQGDYGAGLGDYIYARRWIGIADPVPDAYFLAATTAASNSTQVGGWFYKPTSVPEPATLTLMGLGLAGLGFTQRRMKT